MQYKDIVEYQRAKLAAEEWKDGVQNFHMHSLKSMWYDNRPQDTDDGMVEDYQYNDGRIERFKNGKLIHTFTEEQITGEHLVDEFLKRNA